jgi:hypothetical protein
VQFSGARRHDTRGQSIPLPSTQSLLWSLGRQASCQCQNQDARDSESGASVYEKREQGRGAIMEGIRGSIRLIRGTFGKASTAWGVRHLNLEALQAIFSQTAGQFGKVGKD